MKKQLLKINRYMAYFIIAGVILFTGCSDDNVTDAESQDDSVEFETAFLRGAVNFTPDGSITFLDIVTDLADEPDFSNMVELGRNVDVFANGEHPYTVNPDAKTITKWNVDKKNLEVSIDGILSFASTGVNTSLINFISDEQAFIPDLVEGIIVEFNPTTIEIVKTHNVDPFQTSTNFGFFTRGSVFNGKIIFPLQWLTLGCCEYDLDLKATVGIFDPATGTLTYDRDDRAIGVLFTVMFDGDDAYLPVANTQNSFIKTFYNGIPSTKPGPNVVLKLNDDGTIDDNFVVDINETLPDASIVRSSSFIFQGKYVITHANEPVTGSFEDRWSTRSDMEMVVNSFDLNTKEAKPFTAFDSYFGVFPVGTIDGVNYFNGRLRAPNNPGSNFGSSTDLLIQNSPEDYSVLNTTENGSFTELFKLW